MIIWLVTIGEPSPDKDLNNRLLRTGILARELAARGHDVTWWSSSFDHSAKTCLTSETKECKWDGGRIVYLHVAVTYQSNVSLRRMIHNWLTAREFRRNLVGRALPDLMLVSHPTVDLSFAAVSFARRKAVPALVDVRDLWPDIFLSAVPEGLRRAASLLLRGYFEKTRAALSNADAIIGVSDGYLNWGLQYASRPRKAQDRVFPIGYVDPFAESRVVSESDRDWLERLGIDSGKFIVWFVGSFGKSYDLDAVISAAGILEDSGIDRVEFVISGDGETRPLLEERISGLSSVRLTGWIDAAGIRAMQCISGAGLMAYVGGAPQGLPNKLFEYMSAGLPVLSSLEGETAELISKSGIGLNYDSAESLADSVRMLLEDPDLRAELGRNSRNLFLKDYDARKVYADFALYLESFGVNRPGQSSGAARS